MPNNDETQKINTFAVRDSSGQLLSGNAHQNGRIALAVDDHAGSSSAHPLSYYESDVSIDAPGPGSPSEYGALPPVPAPITKSKELQPSSQAQKPIPEAELGKLRGIRQRCRQLCLNLFLNEHSTIRSLGFTSAMGGEGKTFLAVASAIELSNDSSSPVTLLECNWEHQSLHEYFDLPATPGLAEWLRGECDEMDVRYQISSNLTIIPAGNGRLQAVQLLQLMRDRGILDMSTRPHELLIAELPPIITAAYGSLAARLVESLVMVVRAGATPDKLIAEANEQLKDMPVHGVVLNQIESRIPRWIRQML